MPTSYFYFVSRVTYSAQAPITRSICYRQNHTLWQEVFYGRCQGTITEIPVKDQYDFVSTLCFISNIRIRGAAKILYTASRVTFQQKQITSHANSLPHPQNRTSHMLQNYVRKLQKKKKGSTLSMSKDTDSAETSNFKTTSVNYMNSTSNTEAAFH